MREWVLGMSQAPAYAAYISILEMGKKIIVRDLIHLFFPLKINEWKAKLDQMLPSPLDRIEAWLQEVERLQAEDLPDLQDPFKAMSVFREIIVIFKVC